jgi:hypothetical protein
VRYIDSGISGGVMLVVAAAVPGKYVDAGTAGQV